MEIGPVPGVWIGVISRGKVSFGRGFGVADATTKQPVTEETVFEAASLTKQFTAYAAFRLIESGKLDLDKPLDAYLPLFEDPKAKLVTARHVLSHSSGFPNWRFEANAPLIPAFESGTRFQYSGEGYVCLARVIEALAGMPFGDFLRGQVLEPLGLKSAALAADASLLDRMAAPHGRRGGRDNGKLAGRQTAAKYAAEKGKALSSLSYAELERQLVDRKAPPLPNFMTVNAAASLCTSGPDYARFLARAMMHPAMAKQQVAIRGPLGWGLGWGTQASSGRHFVWQWGDNGGFKNFVMAEPASGSAVFAFTNGDSGMAVNERIVAHVTGGPQPAFLFL